MCSGSLFRGKNNELRLFLTDIVITIKCTYIEGQLGHYLWEKYIKLLLCGYLFILSVE